MVNKQQKHVNDVKTSHAEEINHGARVKKKSLCCFFIHNGGGTLRTCHYLSQQRQKEEPDEWSDNKDPSLDGSERVANVIRKFNNLGLGCLGGREFFCCVSLRCRTGLVKGVPNWFDFIARGRTTKKSSFATFLLVGILESSRELDGQAGITLLYPPFPRGSPTKTGAAKSFLIFIIISDHHHGSFPVGILLRPESSSSAFA
jgi:hypothetical protein